MQCMLQTTVFLCGINFISPYYCYRPQLLLLDKTLKSASVIASAPPCIVAVKREHAGMR